MCRGVLSGSGGLVEEVGRGGRKPCVRRLFWCYCDTGGGSRVELRYWEWEVGLYFIREEGCRLVALAPLEVFLFHFTDRSILSKVFSYSGFGVEFLVVW